MGDYPLTVRALGGGHNRVALWIMGKQLQRLQNGSWEYLPLEEAIRGAGLEEVEEYILRRYNTAAQYIVTRIILDLCEEAVRRMVTRVSKMWWSQEGLDLEGVRVATEAEAEEEGGVAEK